MPSPDLIELIASSQSAHIPASPGTQERSKSIPDSPNPSAPPPPQFTRPPPGYPPHPQIHTAPQPQPTTNASSRRKGLWVASSIGSHINREKFQEETNADIKFVKAYTAKYDESAYFPERNLEDVVPFELII